MSIYRVKEVHRGRSGTISDGMQRQYVRKFDVYTTSQLDGPLEVMFAADPFTGEAIPLLYSSYASFGVTEYDVYAICRSVNPVQDDDDWSVWHVTCEYSTLSADGQAGVPSDGGHNPGGGGQAGDNVELEPPVVEWGFWTREEAQRVEARGGRNPIMNSAHEPFDPLPTREVGGRILTVERNELSFVSFDMSAYAFTVNTDQFVEEDDELTWLCKPITARKVFKGGFAYYRVKYEFHHSPLLAKDGATALGWEHYLLDVGHKVLDATGNPVPYMENGQPAVTLLDGAGKHLTPANYAAKGPTYLTFLKYPALAFKPLKIVID